MTQIAFIGSATANRSLKIGTLLALAVSMTAPVFAQDTVVEGKSKRNDVVERRVHYSDLDLASRQNQEVLISRVRKAANQVCNVLYSGQSPMMKYESRCPQSVYREAKPQIDLAIANANSGTRVAIVLATPRSR